MIKNKVQAAFSLPKSSLHFKLLKLINCQLTEKNLKQAKL